jgi:hypothetical protein
MRDERVLTARGRSGDVCEVMLDESIDLNREAIGATAARH